MDAHLIVVIILILVVAYYLYRERTALASAERLSLMQVADKVQQIRAAEAAAKRERLAARPTAASVKPKAAATNRIADQVPWGDFM